MQRAPNRSPPPVSRLGNIKDIPSEFSEYVGPHTEFERKYPLDPDYRKSLDGTARVWKVYRGESMDDDDGKLQVWDNTINILLTFAGLFSAAVTAFVIESYQFLLPDNKTLSPAQAKWVNNLWFTSLFFALAAALLCILLKQWLDEYRARTRAPAKDDRYWARRHGFYATGVEDWHLSAYISILPVLLHVALFLFFPGVVILLWSLNRHLAIFLASLTGLALVFYVISGLLPVWYPACPSASPLLRHLDHGVVQPGKAFFRSVRKRLRRNTHGHHERGPDEADPKVQQGRAAPTPFDRYLSSGTRNPEGFGHDLDIRALQRLLSAVPGGDASSVACQALGALLGQPTNIRILNQLRSPDITVHLDWSCLTKLGLNLTEASRILRSILLLHAGDPAVKILEAGISGITSDPTDADLGVIVRLLHRADWDLRAAGDLDPGDGVARRTVGLLFVDAALCDPEASDEIWNLGILALPHYFPPFEPSSPIAQYIASDRFVRAFHMHTRAAKTPRSERMIPYFQRLAENCFAPGWNERYRLITSLSAFKHVLLAMDGVALHHIERIMAMETSIGILQEHCMTGAGYPGARDLTHYHDVSHQHAGSMVPNNMQSLALLSLLCVETEDYKLYYPAAHVPRRRAPAGQFISTWALLARMATGDAFATLAFILAPMLCTLRRFTRDSDPLVEEFLWRRWAGDIFAWVKRQDPAGHGACILHVAVHFNELDPDWWAKAALTLERDYPELHRHLCRDGVYRELPPCTDCPSPRGNKKLCFFASSIPEGETQDATWESMWESEEGEIQETSE